MESCRKCYIRIYDENISHLTGYAVCQRCRCVFPALDLDAITRNKYKGAKGVKIDYSEGLTILIRPSKIHSFAAIISSTLFLLLLLAMIFLAPENNTGGNRVLGDLFVAGFSLFMTVAIPIGVVGYITNFTRIEFNPENVHVVSGNFLEKHKTMIELNRYIPFIYDWRFPSQYNGRYELRLTSPTDMSETLARRLTFEQASYLVKLIDLYLNSEGN